MSIPVEQPAPTAYPTDSFDQGVSPGQLLVNVNQDRGSLECTTLYVRKGFKLGGPLTPINGTMTINGNLNVSGSEHITGDLTVLGTIFGSVNITGFALPSQNILIGDVTGHGQPFPITGDITLANNGLVKVVGLQSFSINPIAPTMSSILNYDGSHWSPTNMPTVSNLTITGPLTSSNQAVTKAYVDASTEALNIHPAVNLFAASPNQEYVLFVYLW